VPAIRLLAVCAAFLLFGVLPPAVAQSSSRPNAAKAAIERYLAAVRQHRHGTAVSWISPQLATTKELVYVAWLTTMNIYSASGKSLGVIAVPYGGNFGNGVAVDARENVYVDGISPQNQWVIYEYARGGTQAKRTLLLGTGGADFSQGVAVAKDGTVYAAQPYDNRTAVFAPGSINPTRYLENIPPDNAIPFSVTVDSSGTLLVLLSGSPYYSPAIMEYPHGRGPGYVGPYNLADFGGFGIAADAGNHIVVSAGGGDPALAIFLRNDPTPIEVGSSVRAGFLAFNRKSSRLYYGSVNDDGPAGVIAYPSLRSIGPIQTTDNAAVAVSPAVNV